MRIMINVPKLSLSGGVANYYKSLRPFWKENVIYNTIGKRMPVGGSGTLIFPYDIIKFCWRLLVFRPDVIMVNPSFNKSSVERDIVFLRLASFFHVPSVIFFRGFNWDYVDNAPWVKLRKVFNKCAMIYVLASDFKDLFINKGIKAPISLTTTKVDDNLIKDFDISKRTGKCQNLLFLSRIERNKGDFIAIDSYLILKKKYPHMTLTIVGDGGDLKELIQYVSSLNERNIRITGRLIGKDVAREYENADAYLFPTYHGEGMPNSILEAMSFGLPIITRNLGGVKDFFENGKMGFITESLDPQVFADAIEAYVLDPALTKKTAIYNYQYALDNFISSKVASKLEKEVKNNILNHEDI